MNVIALVLLAVLSILFVYPSRVVQLRARLPLHREGERLNETLLVRIGIAMLWVSILVWGLSYPRIGPGAYEPLLIGVVVGLAMTLFWFVVEMVSRIVAGI